VLVENYAVGELGGVAAKLGVLLEPKAGTLSLMLTFGETTKISSEVDVRIQRAEENLTFAITGR
jgi:hypothetical protein